MKAQSLPSWLVLAFTLTFLLVFTACQPIVLVTDPNATPTPRSQEEALEALNTEASSPVIVTSRSGTSELNFVRTEEGGDLLPEYKARTPEEKVMAFFQQYGDLFGVQQPETELQLVDKQTDSLGVTTLIYQQMYQGVPVYGGQLRARVTSDNQLTSVNGVFLVFEEAIDTVPTMLPSEVTDIALNLVQKQLGTNVAGNLLVAGTTLYIYQRGLLEGIEGTPHLAYEVEITDSSGALREFVYVDAHTGEVVDQVSGLHQIQRRVYDREHSTLALYWREGDQAPLDNPDVENLIAYSEDVYNLFLTMSKGDFRSWNRYDGIMHSVYNATDFEDCIESPNAFWNGTFTAFCPGLPSDDVVAHEWAHAYTESTHQLVYSYQSGALNEAYSDIFGEVVDQLNNAEDDPLDTPRTEGSCSIHASGSPSVDDSHRWLVGEDAATGALRDMWNPTCLERPGKVSDIEYHCGELDPRRFDNGGVHFNSSIPNHAFALLVDGGNYNGYTINAIGLTKAAHIYWRAASIQTPLTDFPMHADALQTACSELALAGEVLPALSTTTTVPFDSTEIVSQADCEQVAIAIDAVELRGAPTQCPALLDPNAPPLCAVGDEVHMLTSTDWESGLDSWDTGSRSVSDRTLLDDLQWEIVDFLPDERPGSAMFVANANALCEGADSSSVLFLESPELEIPEGVLQPRVAFNHWIASEFRYDGGNLKVSVNGGDWELVPEEALEFNPYNFELFPPVDEAGNINSNPLAGEPAFTGASLETDGGSWGQTHVNLYGFATAGDIVRLRFEFGQDFCSGRTGWYVDEVESYYCSSEVMGAMCGNSLLDIGETCDDGNRADGDGCSQLCVQESNWSCTEPIEPQAGSEIIRDGSFEQQGLERAWRVTFDDYSPVYRYFESTEAGPPSDGVYYLWFGGVAEEEAASVSQVVVIPETATELTFDLLVGLCDSEEDYMEVLIDDTTIFSTGACSVSGDDYARERVDISPFADGSRHTLEFRSEIFANNGGASNFFVDQVSMLDNQPISGQPSVCAVTWGSNIGSRP
jgi:cysteine-rich repeat protein